MTSNLAWPLPPACPALLARLVEKEARDLVAAEREKGTTQMQRLLERRCPQQLPQKVHLSGCG